MVATAGLGVEGGHRGVGLQEGTLGVQKDGVVPAHYPRTPDRAW